MKIICVTANLPHGTDEPFVIPEIHQLTRCGHEVLVVPRSPRGNILHGHEILSRSKREGLCSPNVLRAAGTAALRSPGLITGALRVLLGSRSPAVALKNFAVVPKALWLADLATRWRADHIHCHWAGTTATMAMLASTASGIPWSFTAHRWDIVENNLLGAKVRSASFVRFISEDGLRMARATGIGPAENARVLHMGVTLPEKVHPQAVRQPVVLCPARLVEVKGHRFLLQAWRVLQSQGIRAQLWLAGQGELRPELEELSATLGIQGSVRFLGALSHSELLKLYREGAVSAVVLASVDLGNGNHEGIPVALMEAMSYGIPAVATSTGGTPELIVPGSGLLVPPADAAALADAIQKLLLDGTLREQIGDSGRRQVAETFDVVRVAARLIREFEISTRRRARAVFEPA